PLNLTSREAMAFVMINFRPGSPRMTRLSSPQRSTESASATGMKVGELAKRTGLSIRTLHYYDEIGLLHPSKLTGSRHRLYGPGELVRLQQIKSLRQLGLSLEEIRECLDSPAF